MKRSPRALLRPPVTGARRWPATGSRAVLALALAACAGCALHRAAREVRTVREQGVLAGGVISSADAGDLHVVLFRRSDGGAWTIDGVCSLAEQSEVWSFLIDGGTDYAVAALRDRNRDLFHYPSGFPLRAISSALERMLFDLRDEHGFERILIVAHSMGALISRDLVQRVEADPDRRGLVGALVTLASPLAGHSAAKWGLRFAPEPVPAWIDMDPDGEFVRELARPWPADVPHVLLFGFRRGGNVLLPLSSDSVVAVAARLPAWAQESATLIRGFDTDHMEILSDPSAIDLVGRVLAEAADGVPIRGRAHAEEDE